MVRQSALLLLLALTLLPWREAHASPVTDAHAPLPIGSELNEDAPDNPREVFHSEALHRQRSYLVNLGNLAFNSPYILGEVAQKAHMSCGTCHVNGASNPRLFIPGLSSRPGNFDTTGALFNPKADNGNFDPVTIPSLRGARFLAPYGHDGRIASLRDFVSNVIVTEFAGPPPSAAVLDAIVAYIQDIDFLPNPRLDKNGHLAAAAGAAERRGEVLFSKPFPNNPDLSCAACHLPTAAFVDHRRHDVGSGGLYKTPTLVNANVNAPYFHDGRYADYGQVVDHFNHAFDLGLTPQDRSDLVAYLTAVGAAQQPEYHLTGNNVLEDIDGFANVLDIAIAQHDESVITLAVHTVTDLLSDLQEHYPDPAKNGMTGGVQERLLARAAVARLLETLRQVALDVTAGKFDAATGEYLSYRKLTLAAAPLALQSAEPWSLFNPSLHDAHQAALQRVPEGSTFN